MWSQDVWGAGLDLICAIQTCSWLTYVLGHCNLTRYCICSWCPWSIQLQSWSWTLEGIQAPVWVQGAPRVSSILDTRDECEYWFRGAVSTQVLVGPYKVGSVQMFGHFLANWRLVLVVYGCLLACRVSSVVPVAVIPPLMSHKLDISAAIDTPTCSSGKYLRVLSIHILMSTHALTSTRKSDTRTSASINFPRTTSTRTRKCILVVHLG